MSKQLRIKQCKTGAIARQTNNYGIVLSNLAIAEAMLVQSNIKTALPHFIAIVKELEDYYGFEFEAVEDK